MKEIAYSKQAVKVLRRIPGTDAQRIMAKIRQFAENPASLANNVKALAGSPYLRLRVGDWRVIMDDQGRVLEILRIAARGSAYE